MVGGARETGVTLVEKVLILGAGVYQLPLIAAVQRLGFSAVVVSIPGSYPGLDVADEVILVDTRDIGGVCEAVYVRRRVVHIHVRW